PSGRSRDRRARLRGVRRLGRGHGANAGGLSLRRRLPVVRPVAEVRQPQRDARQARRTDPPATNGRRRCRFRTLPFVVISTPTKEDIVQYMLLIFDDERVWGELSEEERGRLYAEYGTFTNELRERSEERRVGKEWGRGGVAEEVEVKTGRQREGRGARRG